MRSIMYPSAVDVERTIEFILESQAKAEILHAKAEIRMGKTEARIHAMEKRLDRRMESITKLLQQGMRMLVQTNTRLGELARAQKETHRSLKALINSLRHGRNGHWVYGNGGAFTIPITLAIEKMGGRYA